MRYSNQQIAELLLHIAQYLEMQDVPFKPRAYEKAAGVLGGLEESVEAAYRAGGREALERIPGVGASIAEKIEELLTTGRVQYYEALKRKTPVELGEFENIEGLGPKSLKKLYRALGVRTRKDLERAARAGKIRGIEGFGAKTEENILKGIAFSKRSEGRFILGFLMPEIRAIAERLRRAKGVTRVEIAGSARRMKETIGDADLLAVAADPGPVMDAFTGMPEVVRVLARGETKSSVTLGSGINVDLRVVKAESYGAALNYFTGSKDHNVALRELAVQRGWKLNEYGLFAKSVRGNERMIAGETEEELYKALKLAYIPPELREMTGEIEAAIRQAQGEQPGLPKLFGYGDLLGDLQVQTSWTDGSESIEAMASAAAARGLRYIAITDHTKRLAMTHGLDEKRLLAQGREIAAANKKFKRKIAVLKGTECDILKDGTLDLSDGALATLDVVGVSVHSYFNLPRAEQTKRVIRAIRNPHVDILFHPTGRIIQKREAYDLDMDAVIRAAKETGTVLEIDAYPDRLDLKDEYVRKCVAAGVKLAIDSDAHAPAHFPYLEYGIAQARRGWAEKKDIVNAWPLEKMLGFLKGA